MTGQAIVLLLGLVAAATDGPRGAGSDTAFDRILLRDRSVVLGVVTAVNQSPGPGQRGSVEFLVRRDWAKKNLERRTPAWERSAASAARVAFAQRKDRLRAWRQDRAAKAADDDRIVKWIDHEVARLSAPGAADNCILLRVRLPRDEVAGLAHRPAGSERLLGLAWLCNLPDPESMPLDALKDALEGRGYTTDPADKSPSPALDRLLPPTPEPDQLWLARRAATELAVDSDLRFLRFNDMVIPDSGAGQLMGGLGLSTALSELKRLLDPDAGQRTDPLVEKLGAIEEKGRKGAVVTRLEIQPDLDGVTVESTLWICIGARRWVPFGSRGATVRPADIKSEAGQKLADDPQVKNAFGIVEALGLGSVPADLKQQSLKIGAATEKALGMARSAFNQDLDALALPVLEPLGDDPAPAPPAAKPRS
jgi:hypothetical protein